LNINPLFRDAIEKCLQYDQKKRIDIKELLKHPMFKICSGLSTSILRMRTTSKSQPRKSLPVYNKIKKGYTNRIVRPHNAAPLNPYISAFSKPLMGRNYMFGNSGKFIQRFLGYLIFYF
jgi:serine/threonine protein kinase